MHLCVEAKELALQTQQGSPAEKWEVRGSTGSPVGASTPQVASGAVCGGVFPRGAALLLGSHLPCTVVPRSPPC